jgi:hypothetical protein
VLSKYLSVTKKMNTLLLSYYFALANIFKAFPVETVSQFLAINIYLWFILTIQIYPSHYSLHFLGGMGGGSQFLKALQGFCHMTGRPFFFWQSYIIPDPFMCLWMKYQDCHSFSYSCISIALYLNGYKILQLFSLANFNSRVACLSRWH